MEFVQYACEKNYTMTYDYLANVYAQGKLCSQNWNKAIECWKKIAAEADDDCI